MKPNRKNPILLASLTFALTLATPSAFAANLYWDLDGATAGSGPNTTPNGTWATGGTTWSTAANGALATSALTTTGIDDLFFSAGTDAIGTYTVTLGANQSAKSLTFQEGAVTVTANTLTLAGGGGITVLAGSGDPTISSNLTVNGNNIINVDSGRTLTLNTGTFTRSAGATVSILGGGIGSSTMSGLSANDATGIIGTWASAGSGTGTTYANFSGSSFSGLSYTGAADGTLAAASTDVSSTEGTVNYALSAAGTLGTIASVNTLRWGGGAGTLATDTSFTTKGIMNAGTGLLTFSDAVTSGASGTEMVVNTANADIDFNGAFTGTITKTGSGTMTLGNVTHSVGGITVNQGILISDGSGITGTTAINSGGTLQIGAGSTTGTLDTSNVTNAGTLIFNRTNTYTLAAANLVTGAGAVTLANTGSVAAATDGQFNTTGALNFGATAGSTTVSALDLTNGSSTFGSLVVRTDSIANNTLTIGSGKTLTASSFTAGFAVAATADTNTALSTGAAGTGGTLTVNGNFTMSPTGGNSANAAITAVDLSGLKNFNVTSTGTGRLTVGSALNSKGTLTLANTANNINVGTLSVGDSGIANYNIAQLSTINLGAGTNALSAPILNIGAVKGGGLIQFAGAGGSVVITGANGAGTATITIGNHSNATYSIGSNTNGLLLAGHDATVSAGAVIIGQKSTNAAGSGAITSELTFDTGTFNATSVSMAGATSNTVSTASGLITGSFTVGGAAANSGATGVVNIGGDLLLANLLSTTAIPSANGSLIINGGTVNVNNTTLTAGGGIFDTSVGPRPSTTTVTLAGGTLNLNGGVIGGTTGTGKRNITNLNFRSGTLQNVLQINGGAGLKKTTDGTVGGGTLILSGTNSFTGGVTIDAGTVQLGSAGALLTTAGSENAVTFGAASTGTLALTGLDTVVSALNTDASPGTTFVQNANGSAVSNATLTIGNSLNLASTYAGTIQDGSGGGTLALTKVGTNTLTLSGANTYSGDTAVNTGTLSLLGGSQASPITVQNGATLGFDIAAPTSSTKAVTLDAGHKISVTGSPTLPSYTLLTTTSTFNGTAPNLDPAIPGYTLMVDGGNTLKLVAAPTNTFASWISNPAFGLALADQDLGDDPDGDGSDNGVENFFGTNPGTFTQGLLVGIKSGNTFTFTHPQNATPASDLTASYRWSKDLASFLANGATDGALTKVDFTTQANFPSPGITTVTATVTGTATSNLFVRVNVTQP